MPRSRRNLPRLLLIAGIILVLCLAGWLLVSPHGMVRSYRLHREISRLKEETDRLARENQALREEIRRLKSDPAYIEEVARKELGMIRENEILFDFGGKRRK